MIASEDCDRRWHENSTVGLPGCAHSIDNAEDIYVNCQVGLLLAKGRQDASQVDNIIDLVRLDQVHVLLLIDDVELLVLAGEVELLL